MEAPKPSSQPHSLPSPLDAHELAQLAARGVILKDSSLRRVWRVSKGGQSYVLKEARIRGVLERIRAIWLRSRVRVEARNLRTARGLGLPCPRPIAYYVAPGLAPTHGWLLLEDLGSGQPVDHALHELVQDLPSKRQLLRGCAELLANGFERGLHHRDLHLGNLWRRDDGELFLLDLHAARFEIEAFEPRTRDLKKLYLSLAWPEDRRSRNALFTPLEQAATPPELTRWRARHLRRRVRRALRPSGAFRRLDDGKPLAWALVRRAALDAFDATAIREALRSGEVLKTGRRGSVVRARLGTLRVVAKSRLEAHAIETWTHAEALALRGLRHATTLAILRDETRPTSMWIVSEELEGHDVGDPSQHWNSARARRLARRFGRYVGRLHATGLRCRDSRLDNFRVTPDGNLALLDLDGVRPLPSGVLGFRRVVAQAADLGRALAWLRYQSPATLRASADDLARRAYDAWLAELRRLGTDDRALQALQAPDGRFRRTVELRCSRWRRSHRTTNDREVDGSDSVAARSRSQ